MAEHPDHQPFTGPHPTNRDFAEQLTAWGFTRRKEEGPHIVFRGPHGGTVRVIRSQLGRADAGLAGKAARLVGVTAEQFWAGPGQATQETGRPASPDRDRITSTVLSIHAAVDRPLGFGQVAELSGGRVTRAQVRTASAVLCREGDLDRIRSGVYQWSGGARARRPAAPAGKPPVVPLQVPAPRPGQAEPPAPASPPRAAAEQLFAQLFPGGVRMTAEILADFERWAELTERLIACADAS